MRTLTVLVAAASLAATLAAAAPAAHASTVEGKIMYLGNEEPTVTINKKTYRVSTSTKVLLSGKPGSYSSLKPGMNCKANVANGALATSLICTGKGRDPLPNTLPTAEQATRPAGQAAGQSGGRAGAGGQSAGPGSASR